MKEIILCKYGELILKGLNRGYFESTMVREIKERLKDLGKCEIKYSQSIVRIEPDDSEEYFDIDEAVRRVSHVFGIATITRGIATEKSLDKIIEAAKAYLPDKLMGYKTFKVEGKRSDKNFPLTSPELSGEVGAAILSTVRGIRVDVKNPDVIVRVEIRENHAYITAGFEKAAGGMPAGTAGKALLLLSGGIDSPVAGYMIARRGAIIEALHFESFPYTSELARDKVLRLADEVCEYTGKMKVHIVSLTKIQEEMRKAGIDEYFTLLLRRTMMRLANRVAASHGCQAIVTGEALGQVASQTMQALTVTNDVAEFPVFRPCIGMDKEDIINVARKIGTFETSIEPYEDCCTVFTPKHPKTRPVLEKLLVEEQKIDFEALENEAFETLNTVVIRKY